MDCDRGVAEGTSANVALQSSGRSQCWRSGRYPLTRSQPTTGPPSLLPSAGGGLLQGRGRTLAKQQLVGESGDQGPRYRRHEEQPQLVEAGVTGKQCWSGGPGGVHRRVSDRDADEVDERQRARPIAMAAKPLGARVSVTPRMT